MTINAPDELGGAVIPDAGDLRTGSLGVVRFDERPPTAWKNGQGSTREIARRLLGVVGPDFVWRISVAEMTQNADFSSFPGVERVMVLVRGDGLTIEVAGEQHRLQPFTPFAFDGEADSHALLADGPVQVLNVMTRSSRMSANVTVHDLSDGRPISIAGPTVAVLLSGSARAVATDGASATLGVHDALIPKQHVRSVAGSGLLAVVRMENFRVWRWNS